MGLTAVREPANREIRAEVLQQMGAELSRPDTRSVSLARFVNSIPRPQGVMAKKGYKSSVSGRIGGCSVSSLSVCILFAEAHALVNSLYSVF